jgi:hypothetical protein
MGAQRTHTEASKQHRNNGERQMANPIPVSASHRNGVKAGHFSWSSYTSSTGPAKALDESHPSSDPEISTGEPGEVTADPSAKEAPETLVRCDRAPGSSTDEAELQELDLLSENARLRASVKELELSIEEAAQQNATVTGQIKEYEGLLEEKAEMIRELHRKMKEQQERPAAATPREEELLALSEELEHERQQLKEDEETLMQQMRDMEVQMSRERAEMARQRNELVRLQNEIRHELELASRDGTLRERLAPLQRRHQELINRRGGAPAAGPAAAPAVPVASEPVQAARKDTGLFRRLFK